MAIAEMTNCRDRRARARGDGIHLRYELQIALRYLRARRRDAFISITTIFTAIGVMIGVAALVIVLAVMSGFEQSLRQRILTLTPQVEDARAFNGSITGYPDMGRASTRCGAWRVRIRS